MSLPIAASHPLGWVVLGAAGFLTYKAGKKAGLKPQDETPENSLSDRMIKGTMKTVYKTQKGVCESLGKAKEKYGTMWTQARADDGTAAENQ